MNHIRPNQRQRGFTLLETMIAMIILSFGILSVAAVYTKGIQASNSNQMSFIAQQKAQEAMETIFTARDSGTLTFANIANVSAGGVFRDGAQPLCDAGPMAFWEPTMTTATCRMSSSLARVPTTFSVLPTIPSLT